MLRTKPSEITLTPADIELALARSRKKRVSTQMKDQTGAGYHRRMHDYFPRLQPGPQKLVAESFVTPVHPLNPFGPLCRVVPSSASEDQREFVTVPEQPESTTDSSEQSAASPGDQLFQGFGSFEISLEGSSDNTASTVLAGDQVGNRLDGILESITRPYRGDAFPYRPRAAQDSGIDLSGVDSTLQGLSNDGPGSVMQAVLRNLSSPLEILEQRYSAALAKEPSREPAVTGYSSLPRRRPPRAYQPRTHGTRSASATEFPAAPSQEKMASQTRGNSSHRLHQSSSPTQALTRLYAAVTFKQHGEEEGKVKAKKEVAVPKADAIEAKRTHRRYGGGSFQGNFLGHRDERPTKSSPPRHIFNSSPPPSRRHSNFSPPISPPPQAPRYHRRGNPAVRPTAPQARPERNRAQNTRTLPRWQQEQENSTFADERAMLAELRAHEQRQISGGDRMDETPPSLGRFMRRA